MNLEEHAREEVHRDIELGLRAAASLQATIGRADAKARVLLGLEGGLAMVVLQQLPTLEVISLPLLACLGALGIAWLAGLTVSSWHLLKVIVPRLTGSERANRFAFPTARPSTADPGSQRDEAWDLVSVLAGIALAKHNRVRRAVPPLVVASAAAGALLATIITSVVVM